MARTLTNAEYEPVPTDLGSARRAGVDPVLGRVAHDRQRPSIAIVEDDENIAALLGLMFTREGFAPLLLPDGRAAELHLVASDAPSAAIIDVMLPYRDGFAVVGAMR